MNSDTGKPMIVRALLPLLILAFIWMWPEPAGVTSQAWRLLAIFVATIIGITLRPLPMGAVAVLGITATCITGTLTVQQSLSAFGNPTIWLIVTAFLISRGFIKTGLGERIAYWFISRLGSSSLGLAYGFAFSDLVLAPAIPSNTARSGGILFPIIRSTARAYGSDPENRTQQKIGTFLIYSAFQVQIVTSAMFMTAMAANPLIVELAAQLDIHLSWAQWALAALVPGLASLLLVPYFVYRTCPPQIHRTAEAVARAQARLRQMQRMKPQEWILLAVFLLMLGLWIFDRLLGLHSTVTALIGLVMLLVTGVLSWDDVLSEKGAWNTLVWFAALVMMATYLNKLGLVPWFSNQMQGLVSGIPWTAAFLLLALVYFYSHYFFASNTAHVSSMYAPFLAVAVAVGTPPMLAALVLAFFSNLFSCMTHYGTGPAPVFFGSDYVDTGQWWRLGFWLSLIHITVWVGIGGFWWKILGMW